MLLFYRITKHSYSFELIKSYNHSGWLEPIGAGGLMRTGDVVDIYDALYALHSQKNLKIHIGVEVLN